MPARINLQGYYDVLILGSGAAGLSTALTLNPGWRIAVLTKDVVQETNTLYAQGGVSAVLDAEDSLTSHVDDTLQAGAGLCDLAVVQQVVAYGKAAIDWLLQLGVEFTTLEPTGGSPALHLTLEGGHSQRRVAHVADSTGRAIETALIARAQKNPNISLFEHFSIIDLICASQLGLADQRVLGCYAYNRVTRRVETFASRAVVLATGGASKAYLYTSNPHTATGDGIAMAYRAGCRIGNMEFMQFHPTCLYHPKARSFLISESLRGEGAILRLPDGTPFMQRFDPRGELAPRDIVARAIDHEMKRLGIPCVYLDISHRPEAFIRAHFPNIYETCRSYGIDIARQAIPVVPAAHYTCGGVMTDSDGWTGLAGLYAVGEVACTGLHGANRMASNSLLECIAFGHFAAARLNCILPEIPAPPPLPDWDESQVTDSDEEVVVSHNWEEIRRFMWDYVGIVRTDKRLRRALNRVELLTREIQEYYGHFRLTHDLIELRNLIVVADLIVRSALARKESRGLHYTLDYPNTAANPGPTVLARNAAGRVATLPDDTTSEARQ